MPERDWKVFNELRAVALERFCERVLTEVGQLLPDSKKTSYDRYIEIFQLIQRRDRELARAFDAPRRSHAIFQLATIVSLGLLKPEELARFTPGTQDRGTELSKAIQPLREDRK